jgi:hypothetical protein
MSKIIYELEKFFKSIKYFGFASPQFLVKGDKFYLTEINPRLSAVPFGIDFGANFPDAFHKAIVNNENIKKKIVFITHPLKKPISYLKVYVKKYKDIGPFLVYLYKDFCSTPEVYIRKTLSREYRKMLSIR